MASANPSSNVIAFPAQRKPAGPRGTVEQEQAILDQLVSIVAMLDGRKAAQGSGRAW